MRRNRLAIEVGLRRLRPGDAKALSRLLLSAPPGYSRFFIPFDFAFASVAAILRRAKDDLFFAIEAGGDLAGFYMLRGFDQGYEVPAYGVWVAPAYQSRGLATLTLLHAFALCRMNGIGRLMLKVHPENAAAMRLYEKMGFMRTGIDAGNGHFVYHKEFPRGQKEDA